MALCGLGIAVAAAVLTAAAPARGQGLPSKVDVRADTIAFFPFTTQTVLTAHGHVVVKEGGRTIQADALRFDLLKNRLTAAGNVFVTGCAVPIAGAAYALDLATDRAVLERLEPTPMTLALRDDDLRTALEEPPPPGTFDAVDVTGQRPYMRSRHAVVTPNAGVRMLPAEFPTGAGPSITLPTYLYTLVQDQHIAYSAAPYASFDQPYSLFGSPASLTAAHLRYDSQNGVTVGIDTHLLDRDRAYAVSSFLPFRDRRFDMLSFQQLRPGLQQTLSGYHTFGAFPNDSLQYQMQHSGTFTKETFSASQFDASNMAQIMISTYEHDVGHYFGYQAHAGYGYDHSPGQYPYTNDFRKDVGAELMAPDFKLIGATFSTRYDYDNMLYDFPHQVTSSTTTLSAGRQLTGRVRLFGQVQISQTNNRYRDATVAATALGLPNPSIPFFAPDGTPFPGYFAFAGANTYRSYELQASFRGVRPDDMLQLTLVHSRDFPQFHGYGRPPLVASFDLTRRLTPNLRVEFGRSYDFGWGGQYFSPQYTLGISP